MPRFSDAEPLTADHAVSSFDCGVESLDLWLRRHALQASSSGSARTHVISDNEHGRVVGYHAMAAASISPAEATPRAAKGMPRHPVPAVLLARLAVHTDLQGRGLGAWLLRDAMLRALSVSDELGVRVMIVHAINDDARAFYRAHGFEPSPTDVLNLQLLLKDIRASLAP